MSMKSFNNAAAVTPSDSADLTKSGMLFIGSVAGGTTLTVTTKGGQTVTFTVVAIGLLEGILVERVWATGTLASAIHVFY